MQRPQKLNKKSNDPINKQTNEINNYQKVKYKWAINTEKKKMYNFIWHQIDTNQNNIEILYHPSQNGNH